VQNDADEILAAIGRNLPILTESYLQHNRQLRDEPIIDVASSDDITRLREFAVPGGSHSVESAIIEAREIYSHRVRMNHPNFFGLIPSPVSPVSWLGEALNSAFNANAGVWFLSSGPSTIERRLIDWLGEQLGLPPNSGGLFVSGGSMANITALMVARDRTLAFEQRPHAVIYVSDQTHSSVEKGLRVLGFHPSQIRKVPTDTAFKMDMTQLTSLIAIDRAASLVPFAVVASCGTTNTGSIDPLHAIADLTEREGMWMHVDGAYGASVSLSGSYRHLISGLGRANSIAWDAHKWLFQTYGCAMVFVRDKKHLSKHGFSPDAEYLRDATLQEDIPNFWNFGIELSRPARAMKLWFTLRVLGTATIGRMIDHGFALAECAERQLRSLPDWEIVSGAQLAIVNFRFAPKDGDGHSKLNEQQLDELNAAVSKVLIACNVAAMLTTKLRGMTMLRICAISPHTTTQDMVEIIGKLDVAAKLAYAAMSSCLREGRRFSVSAHVGNAQPAAP